MEEGQVLAGIIQKATTGDSWEILLDIVGTSHFSTVFPWGLCFPDHLIAVTARKLSPAIVVRSSHRCVWRAIEQE